MRADAVLGVLDPEDEGTTILQNVSTHHKTRDDPRKGGKGGCVGRGAGDCTVYWGLMECYW